jgi:hypothetical protein
VRSLHAAKASRLVRALCDGAPPLGVRQLAALAGTDPGYVSRLLDLFHREELVEREPRGPVSAVHVPRLIRRWAADYRFAEAHRFVATVHPHGVPGALAALRDAGVPHALTARAGAAALLGTALPGVVAAYVDNPERVARIVGAEEVAAGGNLLLIDPFDRFVFDGAWESAGLRYATRAQIVADLLGSPSPGPAQAATLLAEPAPPDLGPQAWTRAQRRVWRFVNQSAMAPASQPIAHRGNVQIEATKKMKRSQVSSSAVRKIRTKKATIGMNSIFPYQST